jgi:hypothetical protein
LGLRKHLIKRWKTWLVAKSIKKTSANDKLNGFTC